VPDPSRIDEIAQLHAALRTAAAAVRERSELQEREKAALQAADRAKDEFLAMLSHELRNPLAALTAAAHILRVADPAHAAAKDARNVIERQSGHMARMVEDLLDVSRLIAGKVTLAADTFDLGQLTTNVVDNWRATHLVRPPRPSLPNPIKPGPVGDVGGALPDFKLSNWLSTNDWRDFRYPRRGLIGWAELRNA